MLLSRNGRSPVAHPAAAIAGSAQVVGDVSIGAECYVDYNAVIASAGPPIVLEDRVIVLANAVIRSTGGIARPAFPVRIGADSLISPLCALAGCTIGRGCYVAPGAVILQGATLGDGARVGVGAIVHAGADVPAGGRVGLRHVAVPTAAGVLITPDP
ncbi:MAG TPA: hypothetical protein VFQ80_04395, partial [Thermomicrobiales bacterium]|nr:hypothetical protein [Thermomicrobiales bacterium]